MRKPTSFEFVLGLTLIAGYGIWRGLKMLDEALPAHLVFDFEDDVYWD